MGFVVFRVRGDMLDLDQPVTTKPAAPGKMHLLTTQSATHTYSILHARPSPFKYRVGAEPIPARA